jgi:hypothetical protein
VNIVSALYRGLATYNDVKAVRRGPAAVGKRVVRKAAYRTTTKLLRKVGL